MLYVSVHKKRTDKLTFLIRNASDNLNTNVSWTLKFSDSGYLCSSMDIVKHNRTASVERSVVFGMHFLKTIFS